MSGIWGWFGGGGAANAKNAPKNAIIELRSTLEMLQKREKYLTSQAEEQQAIARKNVNTNTTHPDQLFNNLVAKAALRRKKHHDHALEQTISQITSLEQQINAIESANINRETLAAMERASKAMSQIHGKLTPETVDATMAKLQDQNALSEEIVAAMNSVNVGQALDDDALDAELAQLQQEQLDTELLKTGTVPVSDAVQRMPAAAVGEIKASPQPVAIAEEDDDEAELKKLRAEMAM